MLLAPLLASLGLPTAFAASRRSVIIVVDASGSMAGKIGGQSKMQIARRVIHELLDSWPRSVDLGLVAYGHRRPGDCSDIQTIYPVGKADKGQVARAIARLRPRGKTPLSAAVRLAAQSLRYTEAKATVILISDGKETCNIDPCRLGQQLESQGVDFTAHVIGFDVRRNEESGLKCLSERTGGRYLAARDAGSLARALTQTVRSAEKQPPGVKLVALVKKGGPEWQGDVAWTILQRGTNKKLAEKWRPRSGFIFRNLPAGEHMARLILPDYKYIKAELPIEVTAGRSSRHAVVLDIGKVRLRAKLGPQSEPLSWDLGWDIFSATTGEKLTSFWRQKHHREIWLPAGSWRVQGTLPDAKHIKVTQKITVAPGSSRTHDVVFGAAMVRLEVTLDGKRFTRDVAFDLIPQAGKATKLEYWRKRSGYRTVLMPGTYQVKSLLPDRREITAKTTLTVAAGEQKPLSIDLKSR